LKPETAQPILDAISWLYYKCDVKNGKNVTANLEVLRPGEDNRALAAQIYKNFSYLIYEFFSGSKGTYANEETLSKFIQQNFGEPNEHAVLLLVPHCGNWELTLKQLLSMGYGVTTIAMSHSHPDVNDFFDELRYHPRLEIAELKQGMKACLSALDQKRVVALACERDYTGRGLSLEMFNHGISFPKGPASLMLRKKPKTFFVSCRRLKIDHFEVELSPIQCPDPIPEDRDESLLETSKIIAKKVFDNIKEHPDQWVTFDPAFKPLPHLDQAQNPSLPSNSTSQT
jgi:lauroyl/myristoyl acyltransferase